MKSIDLELVVYQEGKYYVAQCLDVDVSSFGDSEPEAVANVREALELYFEGADVTNVEPAQHPKLQSLHLQYA